MNQIFAHLTQIQKSYQNKVLDVDNFDIYYGQCVIITGANGTGKSTWLKIINGLIDADMSKIDFQGQTFRAKGRHPLACRSIYLPSRAYLFDCSVEANIAYPLYIRGQYGAQKHKVDEALEWAKLTHLRKRHSRYLSNGEAQKTALARAQVVAHDLWLLDEPTEHLDKQSKMQLCQLLKELLLANHSIILVTHTLEDFENIPHRTFELINHNLQAIEE